MIRLTGGEWKGRKIKTPKGAATRPSAARVREGLFDALGEIVRGGDFYDLCAGSGAVGLEALSRGAAHCTFVESARAAMMCLRENIALLQCKARATCLPKSLPNWLRSPRFAPRPPAIVFLDPPYDSNLAGRTLEVLGELSISWQGSVCVAQTDRKTDLRESYGHWRLRKRYPHGDSALWIYEAE